METASDQQHLSERFEVAFNQIHGWLQKNIRHAGTDKYTDLLRIGFPAHSIIRRYYHDLKMFGRLRNSIVHHKIEMGYYIAEPHEEVVEQIEKIAAQLTRPTAALSIASKPVFYYYDNTKLSDVLTVIRKKTYSIFPIYDDNGYKWLLTTDCIIRWFAEHLDNNSIHLSEVKVKDLYSLSKPHYVEFAHKDAGMFEIEEIFEKYHARRKKLEAVIVNENGKSDKKPLAIVTPWDLVEIDVLES